MPAAAGKQTKKNLSDLMGFSECSWNLCVCVHVCTPLYWLRVEGGKSHQHCNTVYCEDAPRQVKLLQTKLYRQNKKNCEGPCGRDHLEIWWYETIMCFLFKINSKSTFAEQIHLFKTLIDFRPWKYSGFMSLSCGLQLYCRLTIITWIVVSRRAYAHGVKRWWVIK